MNLPNIIMYMRLIPEAMEKHQGGDKPFTIRQFAADLLCFMNDHQIEKTNLLGFSDGGNISMIFAIQHPERVNRLMYS